MKLRFASACTAFALSLAFMAGCSSPTPSASSESSLQTSISAEVLQTESEPGGKMYEATIKVSGYDEPIVFTMDEGIAPQTVDNFVALAESGFYDNLTFHRIMDGFMIQGGDPTGTGMGGSEKSIYGEFDANGFKNSLKHVRGTVSMARSNDPDSASSQFFIVQEDSSFLDGQYAAFGTVTSGMDVVDEIVKSVTPTDDNGTITKDEQPVIESITIAELGAEKMNDSTASSESK